MHRYAEKKKLPYSAEQMFALVADVARYPEFLPWCVGARVYGRQDSRFDADVMIGFKSFRERFTSRVTLVEGRRVDVDYIKGPMKRLYNHWRFLPEPDGGCTIDFEVDFEFRNALLNQMIGGLFREACHRMVHAFEVRADALYGPLDRGQ